MKTLLLTAALKTNLWRSASVALSAAMLLLSTQSSPLQAQTIELEFQIFMKLKGTNGSGWTATLAGETISAGGVGTEIGCGAAVESERRTVRLEINKSYNMITTIGGCVCQVNEEGTGAPLYTRIEFYGLTNCNWMRIMAGGADSITNIAWLDEDTCGPTITWTISVGTNTGSITFDTCEQGLAADGWSTAYAKLDLGTLTPPIHWEIEDPKLGCRVIDPTDYGCVIRAGEEAGTVYVRAYDDNGCFARAPLDLFDPEDAECSGGCDPEKEGEIGDGDADVGSVEASFFLGKSRDGKSAGSLQLVADEPTGDLYSPKSLVYRWRRGDVAVVTNLDGSIRQVKAPQGLADVVVSSASLYTINFYRPGEFGIKTTNGYPLLGSPTPFAVWTVENPELTTTNRLKITQAPANQASVVHEYRWLTNGWELDSANGLRVKTRTQSYLTNEVGTVYEKSEITTTRQGASSVVSQHTRRWLIDEEHQYPLERTWGTGPNAKTNTYAADWNASGQPGRITRWDGSWNWFVYDFSNRLVTNFSAHLNQTITNNPALCRMVVNDYSTNILTGSGDAGVVHPFGPRSETEYILGQAVAKRYHVYLPGEQRDIQCHSTSAAWNDTDNLVTVTKTYLDTYFAGRLRSVKRPDGTMDIYYYATAEYASGAITNQQNVTNIVMSGQPDAYQTNIVDGTKTTTITGPLGQVYSVTTIDIASGILLASETYSDFDDHDRARKVSYLDGTFSYTDYACCGAQTVTNREGLVTTYTRDSLKRVVATTVTTGAGSITTSNYYDAAGNVLAVTRTGGSTITNASSTYDLAGRKLTGTDALGHTTRYHESLPPRVLSVTNADGGTHIETLFRDGSPASRTGTAAFPLRFEYGVATDGGQPRPFAKQIALDAAGADTPEAATNFVDGFGRNYKTAFPGPTASYHQSFFNNKGQRWKERDPDGVITLFQYNAKGEREYTCTDSNRNDVIDFAGQDRISRTVNDVLAAHSTNVLRTRTYAWLTDGSSTSTLLSTVERSVEGFKTWSDTAGAVSSSVRTLPSAGSWTDTHTAPDGSYSITLYQNGRLTSVTRYDSLNNQLSTLNFSYDSHGRRISSTDARTGTTTFAFNNADQVVSTTTPPPGTGAPAQTTTAYFDALGRATNVVQPDGTSQFTDYFLTGLEKTKYGSRDYPVEYTYDPQGRPKTLTTWTNFAAAGGPAVTTWHYHPERGWLTNKVYADGKGTKYSRTDAGRPLTRLWARGTNVTYAYNNFGDPSSITYNDGITPTVTHAYTRRGRVGKVTRDGITTTLFHTLADQLASEANSGGTLNGLRVTNAFDALLRRTQVAARNGASALNATDYTFDNASRLSTVSDGTQSGNYSYVANSPLIAQIAFKQSTTTRMTTRKAYDNLNRLQTITHREGETPSNPLVSSFAYSYNAANQRTRVHLADNSYWSFDYDTLDQLKSGKHYWSDGTPVAGQQFEYGFDDIGNRRTTKAGGDSSGAGLRPASYTINSLNQITQRTVPGGVDVIGAATATATNVNVNNVMAYRRGEYYRAELSINNASAAQWQSITNRAVQNGTTNLVTGNVFLPKTPEVISYDADGNLTNDGRWAYVWDGENRLTRLVAPSAIPTGARLALNFTNDWQGRRISKVVSNWTGSAWSKSYEHKYLYDGWNLIAVLDSANTLLHSFRWGTDLSGTLQGAGGVGGLILMTVHSGTYAGTYFYAHDGNGNVAALINAADGTIAARYEYGPFHELIRATGPLAFLNPFRASTKFQDDETGFLYYGYRYYDPSTGRWLNRDSIEEKGGLNLYGFVANNPVSRVDAQGLYAFDMEVKAYIEGTRVTFGPWTFNAGTKVDHVAHVDTDAESLTQTKFIGTTIKYDSSGNEVDRATASSGGLRAYIRCKKISTRVGCCKECHIQMIGTASDPLFYGAAPPLDYDFFVSVTVCPGSIYFYYSGSHDGYPSYDFNLAGDQVHHFSHVAAGTSPLSLYSWGQYYFRGDKWLMTGL